MMHREADGFTGGVMAAYGISDAVPVLHCQNGCSRGLGIARRCMPGKSTGPGPAVPYSAIDPKDYYADSAAVFSGLASRVGSENPGKLMVMLPSPAVSAIGDDIGSVSSRFGRDSMSVDPDALGATAGDGYDFMIKSIVSHECSDAGRSRRTGVNIIGLSIMHKDWPTYLHELSHLLRDAGIDVICALGCGCSRKDIRESVNADFNIVVDPGYSSKTARFYQEEFGIDSVGIGCCPIGFDKVEELFSAISERSGNPLSHGFSMLKKSRMRAFGGISALGTTLLGKTFSIEAPDSARKPLKEWLESSFGMVEDGSDPHYLFAPGDYARASQSSGACRKGIDIGFPSTAGFDFMKSPVMGLEGAMYLLDGLFSRCCRTPRCEASSPGCSLCGCLCR